MSNIPAGWYDDGQGGQRWWDGTQWTAHTQPGPAAPAAPAAPESPARPTAPQSPSADMPTQIAPNRAADHGSPQQSPYGAAPSQPAYGGGAEPAQPSQSPYGAPVQPAQQPFGAPAQPAQQPYGAQAGGGYGAPQHGAPPASGGGNKKLLLLIGGGVGALVLGIIVLVLLFSVLGGGGPKGVAEDYLEASADGDVEKVCELSSASNQRSLFDESGADSCGDVEDAFNEDAPEGQSIDEFYEDIEVDYEVGEAKEDGDKATVDYTFTMKYTGDEEGAAAFINQDDVKGELTLVKEDGDWKVDGDTGGMIN